MKIFFIVEFDKFSQSLGMTQSGSSQPSFIETVFPSIISCSACLWLFLNYYKLSRKTIGLKMILMLSISDIIFHIATLINSNPSEFIRGPFLNTIQALSKSFSTAWPSAIAYLAYSSLRQQFSDPKKYYKKSVFLVFIISLIVSLM